MTTTDKYATKRKEFYHSQFPRGTIFTTQHQYPSEDYTFTAYETIAIRENYHGHFCIECYELKMSRDGKILSKSEGYHEEYTAWVKEIIKRGDGPVVKRKFFNYKHLPKGTVFLTTGPNAFTGVTFHNDDDDPVEHTVDYIVPVSYNDELEYNIFTREDPDRYININHVTSIVKRGDGGCSLGEGSKHNHHMHIWVGDKRSWLVDASNIDEFLYDLASSVGNVEHNLISKVGDNLILGNTERLLLANTWVKFVPGTTHYAINKKRVRKWMKQNINKLFIGANTVRRRNDKQRFSTNQFY